MGRQIKVKGHDEAKAWNGNYELPPIDLSGPSKTYDWLGNIDCVIRQYTGAVDNDGVEIYEGDIVDDGEKVESIYFNEITAAFETKTSCICSSTMKVVGNIHENPELLGD